MLRTYIDYQELRTTCEDRGLILPRDFLHMLPCEISGNEYLATYWFPEELLFPEDGDDVSDEYSQLCIKIREVCPEIIDPESKEAYPLFVWW